MLRAKIVIISIIVINLLVSLYKHTKLYNRKGIILDVIGSGMAIFFLIMSWL